MNEIHGVNNLEHIVQLLQSGICHMIILALLPPISQGVIIEARLSFLEDVETYVV
jgi:hypothetical protein